MKLRIRMCYSPGIIHIVVGAGNKQVYFYNGSSTVLQMSLKKFIVGAQ